MTTSVRMPDAMYCWAWRQAQARVKTSARRRPLPRTPHSSISRCRRRGSAAAAGRQSRLRRTRRAPLSRWQRRSARGAGIDFGFSSLAQHYYSIFTVCLPPEIQVFQRRDAEALSAQSVVFGRARTPAAPLKHIPIFAARSTQALAQRIRVGPWFN